MTARLPENEIAPCPFCGGTTSEDNACQMASVYLFQGTTPTNYRACQVRCVCGVNGPWKEDQAEAIAAWNRRATPADPAKQAWQLVPIVPTDKMMILGGFRFAGRVPNDQVFPEVHKFWDDMLKEARKELEKVRP
jgi:Lar family restriction alleviation protein